MAPQCITLGMILIHAPSRERHHLSLCRFAAYHFNPRSLAGATLYCPAHPRYLQFQSTLPRRSDRRTLHSKQKRLPFQSTLPRGSDTNNYVRMAKAYIFQSTLPYGSDRAFKIWIPDQKISIHAPLRERPSRTLADACCR